MARLGCSSYISNCPALHTIKSWHINANLLAATATQSTGITITNTRQQHHHSSLLSAWIWLMLNNKPHVEIHTVSAKTTKNLEPTQAHKPKETYPHQKEYAICARIGDAAGRGFSSKYSFMVSSTLSTFFVPRKAYKSIPETRCH